MPRASIFGGSWLNDDNAGSRYANVAYNWPENSNDNIGARGRCDDRIPARRRLRSRQQATHTIKVGGQPACPASANTLQGPAERGVGRGNALRDPRPATIPSGPCGHCADRHCLIFGCWLKQAVSA